MARVSEREVDLGKATKPCECGCGIRVRRFDSQGRPRRFVVGHAGILGGRPPGSLLTDEQRRANVLARVIKEPRCWRWSGTHRKDGVPIFRDRNAVVSVYEETVGAVPEGWTLRNICGWNWCVRPEHFVPLAMGQSLPRLVHTEYRKRCECKETLSDRPALIDREQRLDRLTRPSSVVYGRDSKVIPKLLQVHAVENPRILDVTYNRGAMWKNTPYRPTTMDIDRRFDVDRHGDCRFIPWPDESFDVIAFDPPHLPRSCSQPNSDADVKRTRFGVSEGEDVSEMFEPFLREARRVLAKRGIVIAKIADLIHGSNDYLWTHVDFIDAARSAGMTPCDMIVKIDPSAASLSSPSWKTVKHFRRAHCYWIVVRKARR